MAEIIFEGNGNSKAQQTVAWQTMVSQESLKVEILTLIKEKHSILLSYDLTPVFDGIIKTLIREEAQVKENLLNFGGKK